MYVIAVLFHFFSLWLFSYEFYLSASLIAITSTTTGEDCPNMDESMTAYVYLVSVWREWDSLISQFNTTFDFLSLRFSPDIIPVVDRALNTN